MSRTELVVNLLTRENLFVLVLRDTTPAQIIPRYIIVYQENSPYPNFQEYNLSRDHSMVHQENLFHPSSLEYNPSRDHSMVYQENPFLPCQFSWIQPQQISFHGLLGEPVPSMLVVLLKIYPMFKFVFVFSYYNDVYIHFVFLVRGGGRKILA